MTTYTWDPTIGLTNGDVYIAFVTNQPFGVGLGGSGNGLMAAGDGPFEFAEGNPEGGNWFTYSENAEFHADFSSTSPTPEPPSFVLMLGGILLAGMMFLRKR